MASNLAKIRGKFPADLMDWVLNPKSELTEQIEQQIDGLMEDRRRRVQVFLTALVRRHVERVVFLMERFPMIEAELFTEKRIATMKNSDLIRLLLVVGDQVEDASDFLQRFVSAEDLKAEPLPSRRAGAQAEQPDSEEDEDEEPSEEDRKALDILPAEKRKRVVRIFRRLLAKVEEVETRIEETVPVSEAEK
jgi:hypothetical protein